MADSPGALAGVIVLDLATYLAALLCATFLGEFGAEVIKVVTRDVPEIGTLRMPAVIPRLTLAPGRIEAAGPSTPGQHNAEIYGERLGLGRAELDRLRARGII